MKKKKEKEKEKEKEMAVLGGDLFKERKYPFIVTLLVLFICVTVLIVTNTTTSNPLVFYSDVKEQEQEQPPPLNPSPVPAESSTNLKEQKLPQNMTNNITAPKDEGLPQKEEAVGDVSIDWKLCKEPVTVGFIPCLDNFKAIKALKSRRHMEHRERHCPDTSLHCLLPLPKGYKVPVPWPKSRDMVRLLLR